MWRTILSLNVKSVQSRWSGPRFCSTIRQFKRFACPFNHMSKILITSMYRILSFLCCVFVWMENSTILSTILNAHPYEIAYIGTFLKFWGILVWKQKWLDLYKEKFFLWTYRHFFVISEQPCLLSKTVQEKFWLKVYSVLRVVQLQHKNSPFKRMPYNLYLKLSTGLKNHSGF